MADLSTYFFTLLEEEIDELIVARAGDEKKIKMCIYQQGTLERIYRYV